MKELLEFMSEIRCATGCDNVTFSEDETAIRIRMDWRRHDWHVQLSYKRARIENTSIDVLIDALCIVVLQSKERDGIE